MPQNDGEIVIADFSGLLCNRLGRAPKELIRNKKHYNLGSKVDNRYLPLIDQIFDVNRIVESVEVHIMLIASLPLGREQSAVIDLLTFLPQIMLVSLSRFRIITCGHDPLGVFSLLH